MATWSCVCKSFVFYGVGDMEKNLIIAEQTSQLGYGVNISTGEVLGTCLDIESINLPDNEGNIIDPLEVVSLA